MSAAAFTKASAELRGLPANVMAEQGVLGAVLFDNTSLDLVEGLEARHFHDPFHGLCWSCVIELVTHGRSADPVAMTDRLRAEPGFDEMGGTGYLIELMDKAPPQSAIPALSDSIKDNFVRREIIRLAREASAEAQGGAVDASAVISRVESALLAIEVGAKPLRPVTAAFAAARVLEYLDAPKEQADGIYTGLDPLDRALGPMMPGDLVLFMGRPGMGKSAAAECVAVNIADRRTSAHPNGHGVIQINGEMSIEQMARRHLADLAHKRWHHDGPKYSDMRRREISPRQRQMLDTAAADLSAMPLVMLKKTGLYLSSLRSVVRRQKIEWARQGIPLAAVIIDHVGLMKSEAQGRGRYDEQTEISNGLKELAGELDTVVIALNQMNRQNESRDNKRPQLADLRDSGSWEQDADVVIGWYREAYYAQRETEPEKSFEWSEWDRRARSKDVEAIVLKAREGETKTVKLWADVARNAIRSAPVGDEL